MAHRFRLNCAQRTDGPPEAITNDVMGATCGTYIRFRAPLQAKNNAREDKTPILGVFRRRRNLRGNLCRAARRIHDNLLCDTKKFPQVRRLLVKQHFENRKTFCFA